MIWMTESQEFFRVVCGTGVGVHSATFMKRYIVMLLKIGQHWVGSSQNVVELDKVDDG